jgi:hypothetical protein
MPSPGDCSSGGHLSILVSGTHVVKEILSALQKTTGFALDECGTVLDSSSERIINASADLLMGG